VRVGVLTLPAAHGDPRWGLNIPSSLPWGAIYDSLTWFDENGAIQPALAERWWYENENSWVFELREGIHFSNGEPLDADAVVAAIENLKTLEGRGTVVASSFPTRIEAAARDASTVVITTSKPTILLPYYLRMLRIPAPRAWKNMSRAEFSRNPVGTGPFKVTKWTDSQIAMTAFGNGLRRPQVDELIIKKIPDAAARLQAFVSGAIDIALNLAPEDSDMIETGGGSLIAIVTPHLRFISFDTLKNSPLRKRKVRIALNYAVNKQRIINVLLNGATTPASQFVVRDSFGFNPDLEPYAYDPEKARTLLKEAGFRSGFKIRADLVHGNGGNDSSWYQQIAADLKEVGVTLELYAMSLAQLTQHINQGNWPGEAFGMFSSGHDTVQGHRMRACTWMAPHHCDPEVDALANATHAVFDIDRRTILARELVKAERSNPPGILLWQDVSFNGVAGHVKGFRLVADLLPFDEIYLTHD